MHRMIKKLIGLTMIMLSLGTLAHAEAPKCEIVTESNKDYLTVVGSTTETAGTRVSVMLVKPESKVSDIVNDDQQGIQANEALEAFTTVYVENDADGNKVYKWKYEMHTDCLSGEYLVRTKVYGSGKVEEVKVTYLNKERINAAFDAADANSTPMADILTTYGKDLDAQSGTEFLSYQENSEYYNFVVDGMDSETFTNSEDMQNLFKEYVGITKVASKIKSIDKIEVKNVIENSHDKIPLNENDYLDYSNLDSDSKKEAAIAHMISLLNEPATIDDVISQFGNGVEYAMGIGSNEENEQDDDNSSYTPSIPSTFPPKMDPVNTQNGSFDDISNVAWAVDAIESLVKHGVVNGKAERLFCPNDFVKREEFVKMIVEAFKLSNDSQEIGFTDVSEDSWYYNYVKIAFSSGIVNGVSETQFGAGNYISRQDMAVMIKRAADLTGVEVLVVDANKQAKDFDSVAEYAQLSVKQLSEAGVINGDENGNFNPSSSATRAHAAVMLYNLLYK